MPPGKTKLVQDVILEQINMSIETEKTMPLKAVYAYYFPEVRAVIDKIAANYPHETFLQSVEPGLDDYHRPVIESYLRHFENQLPDLKKFPYQYVTGGANEGIFHILAQIAASANKKPLYVLEGEYEGYAGYGANLGLEFKTVKEPSDFLKAEPGIIFVSNPSARDGNIIPDQEIIAACNAGHKVVYDSTYVGLTNPYRFNLDHENIIVVLTSLSKPFGLYYHRIGFTFTRNEMKTLEVNKWFKNILSLRIAKDVLDTIGETQLVDKYRPWQTEAIMRMEQEIDIHADKSQVVLLANAKNGTIPNTLEKYSRKHNYRFCLTPYYLTKERGHV
jgi:histidinol-phosphate/aromatic aminotransferase/cobyric acid decarboxylase-like protein